MVGGVGTFGTAVAVAATACDVTPVPTVVTRAENAMTAPPIE
jgi:hypothetical protein